MDRDPPSDGVSSSLASVLNILGTPFRQLSTDRHQVLKALRVTSTMTVSAQEREMSYEG